MSSNRLNPKPNGPFTEKQKEELVAQALGYIKIDFITYFSTDLPKEEDGWQKHYIFLDPKDERFLNLKLDIDIPGLDTSLLYISKSLGPDKLLVFALGKDIINCWMNEINKSSGPSTNPSMN